MFENRVLRTVFGPKKDKVTGAFRKLHNELHNLYSSPNVIRRMECVGYGGYEKCIQNFDWKD
jgi:hypothetical protein